MTFGTLKTITDGAKYASATRTLNEALETEDRFYLWIDLPDGTQFVVPKGSKLNSLNYSINIDKDLMANFND